MKNDKIEIPIKNINDDFSEEIKKRKRIIILVEHSKSYAKEYSFKTYINKRFKLNGNKYTIAVAHLDFINIENLDSKHVIEKLKDDLNKVYNDFKAKYPNAILEKPYSFNYAIDYSPKTQKAEIMTIALMRVTDEYTRVQFSPIITISKKTYDMLMGKDTSQEGKLLYDILTEKRMGIEQFGLIGYLTNGKYKTYSMYMESLMDLIPEYKNETIFRPKLLEYKNYRTSKNAYMFSIKTEDEKQQYIKEHSTNT